MSNLDQTRVMGAPGSPLSDRTMVATPRGGVDLTQQMPLGGLGGDMLRTQMGGTTTCPICSSSTPLPETYCGDCGFLLTSPPIETPEIPTETPPVAELVDVANQRRFRLRPGANTIGRQGADILVNEGTVSRIHAKLTIETDGTVFVEDMGSTNGTKVGERRLSANEAVIALHGTPLKFGSWRVMLEVPNFEGGYAGNGEQTVAISTEGSILAGMSGDTVEISLSGEPVPVEVESVQAAPLGPLVAWLKLSEGPAADIPIHEGTVSIGRKSVNTITITNDSYVSGRHAEILTDNTGTYLTDLGSTNGTVVNGERLLPNEPQLLLEGDAVQLGQSKFTFNFAEEEAETSSEAREDVEKPDFA